jgi:cytochrome c-type biogenesis protein CcmH
MILFWFGIAVLIIIALAIVIKPLLFFSVKTVHQNGEKSYLAAIIFLLLIPIMSLSIYLYSGSSQQVGQWLATKTRAEQVKKEIAKYGSRDQIIAMLHRKLNSLPANQDTAKGWHLLGKLYFNEGNLPQAIQAFQKAVSLNSHQADFAIDYVSAKFYLNHELTEADKKRLLPFLTRLPSGINAINLLALDAYQHNHFEQAIRYWEGLLQYFPPDSEDSKNLLEMIHQAQTKIPKNVLNVAARKIDVTVTIADSLKNKMSHQDFLFIYALEANGSNIPVAVVKLKADHFPIKVLLSNEQSMIPGHSLEKAESVYIQARISKTGNAQPASGDLMGKSNFLKFKSNHQRVVININQAL